MFYQTTLSRTHASTFTATFFAALLLAQALPQFRYNRAQMEYDF
ncbi:MAG TPA: hypothetical protein VGC72_14705 [Candidatus Elarobacter sp.]